MFELAPFLGALVGDSGGPFAVVGMSVMWFCCKVGHTHHMEVIPTGTSNV